MDEIDTQLFKNSITFLHNVSSLPEINIPILKSFLCLKRRLMELRKNTFLPINATKQNIHCRRCFLNYFDGPASYKIKPRPKKRKFLKKLLSKQQNGLSLTKYQEKYIRRNKSFEGNQLVVSCKFCKFETRTKLPTPIKKAKRKILTQSATKKKKNKTKKDKFCGLKESVVMSASLDKSKDKHDADIICLDDEDTVTPVKLIMKKKKEKPIERSTPKPILNTPSSVVKKNNKSRGKLTELLKNSSKKNKSSSNLIKFLQSL